MDVYRDWMRRLRAFLGRPQRRGHPLRLSRAGAA
jgi:hypothetical protein